MRFPALGSFLSMALMVAAVVFATGTGFAFAADHGPAALDPIHQMSVPFVRTAAASEAGMVRLDTQETAVKATIGRIVHFYDHGLAGAPQKVIGNHV